MAMALPSPSPTPPPPPLSPTPSSPSYRVVAPSVASTSSDSGPSGSRDLGRGDELGLLKHQVRLLKAENSNLREKLGTRPNPAPFGSSLPRRTSDGLPLPPAPHSLNRRPSAAALDERSTSPLPGSVSLNQALLPSSPPLNDFPPTVPVSSRSNGARSSNGPSGAVSGAAENPFFGSGASRERMKNSVTSAQSGTGKVISGLQSDLLAVRGQLDTVRATLRNTQKALENATRQNEELRDAKERFSSEGAGLGKMIERKEKILDEWTARATTAEKTLEELRVASSRAKDEDGRRIRELEGSVLAERDRRGKAESEYSALREGMKSMADGWRSELDWVRKDLGKVEGRHGREVQDLKGKEVALSSLLSSRETEQSTINTTVSALSASHKQFVDRTNTVLAELAAKASLTDTAKIEESYALALKLEDEFKRLRRMMREHAAAPG